MRLKLQLSLNFISFYVLDHGIDLRVIFEKGEDLVPFLFFDSKVPFLLEILKNIISLNIKASVHIKM
jgi:hypothetical protein